MNHRELVADVAAKLGVSKNSVDKVLSESVKSIGLVLKQGGSVNFSGIGTFVVKKQAARVVISPRTGAPIRVKAKKKPRLKVSAVFERIFL